MVKVPKLVLTLVLFCLNFNLYSQKSIFSLDNAQPASSQKLEVIDHTYFRLGYNAKHKNSSWVAYILTKQMVSTKNVERAKSFKKDKSVSVSALSTDYNNSGYDRGHLCPAADMAWKEEAMKTTFLMSNISPQMPQFNRGKWKALEEKVRSWAADNDSIIVITGAILDNCSKGKIGKNKVSVPCRFYKIVIDISYPTYKAIAFVMDNDNLDNDIFTYVVSISDIELATSLDFFPAFKSNSTITDLEHSTDVLQWK
ncbi:MAG: DNA/RNA non-specific endonuclease [Bacteroidales bacterium]|jgi:endonuclease G|nr:DNA/RNA non-specific endonuclease [Bacteroidales bacterium]